MRASRRVLALGAGVLALTASAFVPGVAATLKPQRKAAVSLSLTAPGSIGSFTPAVDPRRSAAFGRAGLAGGSADSAVFRFTPSSAPGSRRAVTVAVRARGANGAQIARNGVSAESGPVGMAPSVYNLGLSVGWKRFALSGDVARVEGGLLPDDRESADIGVSYSGKTWSTRLALGADRSTGTRPRMISSDESYSLDLGGSYSLTRNLAVTGGLRYKSERERLEPIADDRRDSQAIYIGTAFRF